jgi:hypothetical protein
MDRQNKSYDLHVMKHILANNEFGIKSFSDFESLSTGNFDSSCYKQIEDFIKIRDFNAIDALLKNTPRTNEYIDIIQFKDQDFKEYFVSVYDNDALEQDPQIIKIYPL